MTTAVNHRTDGYTYYGMGGPSWSAPYLAGLMALALQLDDGLDAHTLYQGLQATVDQMTQAVW